MAEEILASVQVRRDSKANWENVNPILLNGEAAYEQDTDMFKIGDGVKRYSDLPYHNKVGPQGEPGPTPQISMNVSTGNPGTSASVSVTGTAENPVINLTVPRGDTGKTGSTGPKGDTGSSGVYIGTSQPTDSNINVWIDSDGEPTEVIDDLAREEISSLKNDISALNEANAAQDTDIVELDSKLSESIVEIENTLGLKKVSIELGKISLSGGSLAYTTSNYGFRTKLGESFSVKKGDVIRIDNTGLNLNDVSIYDSSDNVMIANIKSAPYEYAFTADNDSVVISISSYESLVNASKDIVILFVEPDLHIYNAKLEEIENKVNSANDSTSTLRENVESVLPLEFSRLSVDLLDKCVNTSGQEVDLSQYGSGYKHANIGVVAGESFKITTLGSKYYPHFMFFDTSNRMLASYYTISGDTSSSNITISEYETIAPENAVKMVVNTFNNSISVYKKSFVPCVGKGETLTKKYYAFGDSVCRGNYPDARKSNYAWPETFGKVMGLNTVSVAQGGSGWVTTRYDVNGLAKVQSIDISDADLITISWAINDAADASVTIGNVGDTETSTVMGMVDAVVSYIYQTAPKMQLVICGSTPQNGAWSERLTEVNTKLKQFCEQKHIAFVDLIQDCPINSYNGLSGGALTADGTHFNDDGYKLLAQYMCGKLSALYGYKAPILQA